MSSLLCTLLEPGSPIAEPLSLVSGDHIDYPSRSPGDRAGYLTISYQIWDPEPGGRVGTLQAKTRSLEEDLHCVGAMGRCGEQWGVIIICVIDRSDSETQ